MTHPPPDAPARIRLASEPTLVVGKLCIEPATRQVRMGKREETLEPRVMQVLVALARAKGSVVSRDELIETCWDGRVVGEDAIHRVLFRLRGVAEGIGGGTFHIETIRGVGYRLSDSLRSGPGAHVLSRRSLVAVSGAVAATAAAGAGVWLFSSNEHKPAARAIQYYQRGLQTRGQDSVERMEQGAALFREATRIDPQLADAWGALALSYRSLQEWGPRPDVSRLAALSRSAAARALELDPANVDARTALLLIVPFRGNWAPIERGLRTLLNEHPSNSIVELNLGFSLCEVGRWKDAIPSLRRVTAREPFWPLPAMILSEALYSADMDEEADDLVESAMRRFPRRTHFWVVRMRHMIGTGRLADALAFAGDPTMRPNDITDPRIDFETWVAHALSDGTSAARDDALSRISATLRDKPAMLEAGAHSACMLGNLHAALAMLEGFYFGQGPWGHGQWYRAHTRVLFWPGTASLRSDARFASLLRRLGLEQYWQSTGTVPDYRRYRST